MCQQMVVINRIINVKKISRHSTTCNLFTFRIVFGSCTCLVKIIISYLKPYNCSPVGWCSKIDRLNLCRGVRFSTSVLM